MRYVTSSLLGFVIFGLLLTAPLSGPALAASTQGTQSDTLAAPSGLTVTAPAIKGDIPTGEYYLVDCLEYEEVDPATMLLFATEEEAQRLGFHKAQHCP